MRTPDPMAIDTIEAARHFLNRAEDSLINFRFSDFHDLLESFSFECHALEEKGIEADTDYWEINAHQFSDLWFLYAYAEYLREKAFVLTDKILGKPNRDLTEIAHLLSMFHESALDFQVFVPTVDRSYTPEYMDGARDAYLTDLRYWQTIQPKEDFGV